MCNAIFGFNGWSSTVQRVETDYLKEDGKGRWGCVITAQVGGSGWVAVSQLVSIVDMLSGYRMVLIWWQLVVN
jgi:hypothetical protein